MEVWLFRLLVVAAAALFARQMLARYRLVARAPGGFDTPDLAPRIATFISEIVFQSRTIRARPVVGLAHLLVFWGFCAFGGYTTGRGAARPRHRRPDRHRRLPRLQLALVPFSVGVLAGIVLLAIRRGVLRPRAHSAPTCRRNRCSSACSSPC